MDDGWDCWVWVGGGIKVRGWKGKGKKGGSLGTAQWANVFVFFWMLFVAVGLCFGDFVLCG